MCRGKTSESSVPTQRGHRTVDLGLIRDMRLINKLIASRLKAGRGRHCYACNRHFERCVMHSLARTLPAHFSKYLPTYPSLAW